MSVSRPTAAQLARQFLSPRYLNQGGRVRRGDPLDHLTGFDHRSLLKLAKSVARRTKAPEMRAQARAASKLLPRLVSMRAAQNKNQLSHPRSKVNKIARALVVPKSGGTTPRQRNEGVMKGIDAHDAAVPRSIGLFGAGARVRRKGLDELAKAVSLADRYNSLRTRAEHTSASPGGMPVLRRRVK